MLPPDSDTLDMNNLLVQLPPDASMMDIGRNCAQCRKLDFLPVVCEYCKLTFCSDHYKPDLHQCGAVSEQRRRTVTMAYAETAALLFPDREKDKKKIDEMVSKAPKPTTILQKSFRVGDAATSHKNAFKKFAKFLNLQKEKQNTGIKKLFGKPKTSSPALELVRLKKEAKGDSKVGASDRVYVWCLYIDASEEEDDKLKNIDVDKEKKPLFVSKQWPVGRGLDAISDHMKIRNNNNKTSDASERLNIFRIINNAPEVVKTSERCSSLKNGEVLYLVRGTLV